jgi:hypothetical protein
LEQVKNSSDVLGKNQKNQYWSFESGIKNFKENFWLVGYLNQELLLREVPRKLHPNKKYYMSRWNVVKIVDRWINEPELFDNEGKKTSYYQSREQKLY